MGTRSVRLDEQTEALLEALTSATGMSVSEVMKEGVVALASAHANDVSARPYDVFAQITVGRAPPLPSRSRHKRAVSRSVARKLGR
jgi:hypothetical protein